VNVETNISLQRKNVDKQTALFTTRVTTTRMIHRQLKDCASLTVADGKLGRPCPVAPPPLLLLLLLHLHLHLLFFFFLLLVGSSAPISLHPENKTLFSAPTPYKSKVATAKAQNKVYNNNIIIFLIIIIIIITFFFFFFFFFFLKISFSSPFCLESKVFPPAATLNNRRANYSSTNVQKDPNQTHAHTHKHSLLSFFLSPLPSVSLRSQKLFS
jgi:hypothetical protein